MNKKILLTLGSLATIVAPIAITVSCGSDSDSGEGVVAHNADFTYEIRDRFNDSEKAELSKELDILASATDADWVKAAGGERNISRTSIDIVTKGDILDIAYNVITNLRDDIPTEDYMLDNVILDDDQTLTKDSLNGSFTFSLDLGRAREGFKIEKSISGYMKSIVSEENPGELYLQPTNGEEYALNRPTSFKTYAWYIERFRDDKVAANQDLIDKTAAIYEALENGDEDNIFSLINEFNAQNFVLDTRDVKDSVLMSFDKGKIVKLRIDTWFFNVPTKVDRGIYIADAATAKQARADFSLGSLPFVLSDTEESYGAGKFALTFAGTQQDKVGKYIANLARSNFFDPNLPELLDTTRAANSYSDDEWFIATQNAVFSASTALLNDPSNFDFRGRALIEPDPLYNDEWPDLKREDVEILDKTETSVTIHFKPGLHTFEKYVVVDGFNTPE